jgi:hypothetical protein
MLARLQFDCGDSVLEMLDAGNVGSFDGLCDCPCSSKQPPVLCSDFLCYHLVTLKSSACCASQDMPPLPRRHGSLAHRGRSFKDVLREWNFELTHLEQVSSGKKLDGCNYTPCLKCLASTNVVMIKKSSTKVGHLEVRTLCAPRSSRSKTEEVKRSEILAVLASKSCHSCHSCLMSTTCI